MQREDYLFFPYLIDPKEAPKHSENRVQVKVKYLYPFSLPCHFVQRLALLFDRSYVDSQFARDWFEVWITDKDYGRINVLGFKILSAVDVGESIVLSVSYPGINYNHP